MRKRKRPAYLNDFVQNPEESGDVEVENPTEIKSNNKKLKRADDKVEKSKQVEKKKEQSSSRNNKEILVESLEGECTLCEEKLSGLGQQDISTSTGSSDSSYATILNEVFNNSGLSIPRLLFSSGQICLQCKVPIKDLDLFQNKIIGLKKVILAKASKKLEGITREQNEEVSNPESHDVREEVVADDEDDVTKAEEKRRRLEKLFVKKSPSVISDKSVRPRREKPQNSMSEIEKAKIKNLKSDMKFSVKKRSQSDVYIIEYLKEKKGSKYLVKWENRHESENSWELKNKIPSSVLEYYEEDLRRLGSPVPVTVGTPVRKEGKEKTSSVPRKRKRSQPEDEEEDEDGQEEEKDEDEDEDGQEEEKDEDEDEDGQEEKKDEENQQTQNPPSSPVDDNQDERTARRIPDDELGEYIEDMESFEFTSTENGESQLESPEDNHVRKSSRTPKPKTFGERFVSAGKPKKSEVKESTPILTKKIAEKDRDDVEKSVRKSKRELKPPRKFSPQEKPKKKPPRKEKEKEDDSDSDVYIIEALVDKREGKYLVKWLDYPSSENTWEPKSAIPRFILKFYEQDSSRLGMPAPDVS